MPMLRFVSAPWPVPITSGIMPATSAIVVIRMGRNPSRSAAKIAS